MVDFTMPSLGADMEEGTLVEWLVAPGQAIRRGELIAVVETRKGAIEVECFTNGTVAELVVAEGEKVPVGTVLARIAHGESDSAREVAEQPPVSEPAPAPAAPAAAPQPVPTGPVEAAPSPAVSPSPVAARVVAVAEASPAPGPDRVRAAPAARRRAMELGVDLASVCGTGPRGAVQREDVERVAQATAAAAGPGRSPVPRPSAEPAPLVSPMRAAIADTMSRANREIPHYFLEQTVDLSAATAWLAATNAGRSADRRLLPAALFIKATALALARHPALNGHWRDGAFVPGDGVHPGIAIALRSEGLVAPALLHADQLALDTLMARLSDLVERARAGRLRGQELTAGTCTITNLGDRGAELVHGLIHPPQVALVGFGRVVERPWAVDGMLAVRPLVRLTLAGDHRATDGHVGSQLLRRVDRLLQSPERL